MSLLSYSDLQSQEIDAFWSEIKERIEDKDYVRVSGNLRANLLLNQIRGIAARTAPFSARVNAGLLIDVLGFKGPFSLAISDRNKAYRLPAYSFVGFSPSYKWLKIHLGDRSMNFSPYTLSGQSFRGVGMEASPGRWRIALLQGILNTSRIEDAGAIQGSVRPYPRRARALKVSRNFDNGEIGIHVFHAIDKITEGITADSILRLPKGNLVLELNGEQQLANKLELSFSVAHSILTRDLNAAAFDNGIGLKGSLLGLAPVNASTSYTQAYDFGLAYQLPNASLRVDYEKIDAGYQSLGTLSFLNDMEQISLGGTKGILNNRVNLTGSFGVQRNGLSTRTLHNGVRVVSNLGVGASIGERWNGSVSFSNYNFTQRQRISTIPFVVVDSVVIVQSNFNIQGSVVRLLGEDKTSSIALIGAWQRGVTSDDDEQAENNENQFYSTSLLYSFTEPNRNISLSTGITWNASLAGGISTEIWSPSLTLSYPVLPEKITLNSNVSFSYARVATISISRIFQIGLSTDYTLSERQRLALRSSWVNTQSENGNTLASDFSDLNVTLSYSLNF